MQDRRDFMKLMASGAMLAASSPFANSAFAAPAKKGDTAQTKNAPTISLNGNDMGKVLGLGGVPLAGAWIPTEPEDSLKTLQMAWDKGIRYFDTSPRYGFGVSERRMGAFLSSKNQEEFIISTKVGRLLKPTNLDTSKRGIWTGRYYAESIYDYTAAGTRKSIEDSLQRLGLAKLDIVFIHDLSPDNMEIADKFDFYYEQAAKGAIPELAKMKKEGLIKAWGFGINRPDAALRSLSISEPDICLMATQYSLLDHNEALEKTFPALEKSKVRVAVGSPLNCGYLAGNDRWNYSRNPAPAEMAAKREKIRAIAKKHKVDLRTAALQFSMAHPVVTSVLVGARSAKQISEDYQSLHGAKVPKAFWEELRQQNLIHKEAPIPG
ncbi:aldo/keto reductase [Bdellovibrio sp. HCB209]|uniref:aldo/keto reductase n=1 Tax=Bdellovibrio sp. HCB209 TaxID=3394354 RepID=UPI0039B5986B